MIRYSHLCISLRPLSSLELGWEFIRISVHDSSLELQYQATFQCKLTVLPKVATGAPRFLEKLSSCKVVEGGSVELSVRATGRPAPALAWQKVNSHCWIYPHVCNISRSQESKDSEDYFYTGFRSSCINKQSPASRMTESDLRTGSLWTVEDPPWSSLTSHRLGVVGISARLSTRPAPV